MAAEAVRRVILHHHLSAPWTDARLNLDVKSARGAALSTRHCEERSDEAIHGAANGLLRLARNDEQMLGIHAAEDFGIGVLPPRHDGQNTSVIQKSRGMSSPLHKNIHLSENRKV
jgi:hypothetical protein